MASAADKCSTDPFDVGRPSDDGAPPLQPAQELDFAMLHLELSVPRRFAAIVEAALPSQIQCLVGLLENLERTQRSRETNAATVAENHSASAGIAPHPAEAPSPTSHRYNSRLPVVITGERRKRRNVVLIDGTEILLADAAFKGLMPLVLAAAKIKGGWLARSERRRLAELGLEEDWDFYPTSIDKTLLAIRDAIGPVVGAISAREFIEASGDGRFRLSTPPGQVHWNGTALLQHPLEEVRAIAALLPESVPTG